MWVKGRQPDNSESNEGTLRGTFAHNPPRSHPDIQSMQDALYATGLWAHKYPLECITIDGQRVATGAHKEIKIWDWDTNRAHPASGWFR